MFIALCPFMLSSIEHRAISHNEAHFSITPTPAWVKEKTFDSNNATNEQSIQYLLYETQYEVDQQLKYTHIAKKLSTPAAVQQESIVQIEYDPVFEIPTLHTLYVIRNGQRIDKITTSRMETIQQENDMAQFQFNGRKTWVIFVDDVHPGDILEYSFTRTGRNPILKGYFCENLMLTYDMAINHLEYRVVASKNRHFNFKSVNTDISPRHHASGNKQEWIIQLDNVKPYKAEAGQPGWYTGFPLIQFTEFNNWHEVALWGDELFNPPESPSPEMRQLVDTWKSQCPNLEDQIIQAVRFVQNDVRYFGFEVGHNTHMPNDPNMILKSRIGDCKDKTILLKTFLDLMGVESHPVLVNSTEKGHVSDWLPSTNAFNHVILQICLGENKYWIDGTCSYQGGGDLRQMNVSQYGKGLTLDSTTTQLTDIPMLMQDSAVHLTSKYEISNAGTKTMLTSKTVYSGREADAMRYTYKEEGLKSVEKHLLGYYSKLYGQMEQIGDFQLNDDIDANQIVIESKYEINDLWEVDNEKHIKSFSFFSEDIQGAFDFKVDTTRKSPQKLKYPLHIIEDVIIVNTEQPWNLTEYTHKYETDQIKFENNVKTNEHELAVHFEIQTKQDNVPVADLAQHKKVLHKIEDDIYMTVTLPLSTTLSLTE